MDGTSASGERRTTSPAVVASALFVAASAVFAMTFVAGRGGLQMPVAPTRAPVAVASEAPGATSAPQPTAPPETLLPATLAPPSTLPPTAPPTTAPTSPPATQPPSSLDPNDPLAALRPCPDRPGCFEYVIVRGDTLTGIVSRYLLSIATVFALNPELDLPRLIAGDVLHLGRDPLARLEPCPNGEPCALYVIEAGDRLADLAARYGLTVEEIRAANPTMSIPIVRGETVKLPRSEPPAP